MSVVRALRSGRARRLWALALLWMPLQSSCGVDEEVPSERVGDAGLSGDPWAAPLSFVVSESVRPSADAAGTIDGRERRVGALASPDGQVMELLVDELIVGTVDDLALAPLLARRGGELLWKVESGSPREPGFSLVRIEPESVDGEDVVRLVRELGEAGIGLEGGEHRVSHPDVLGLLAALLEEATEHGMPVSPNAVMSLATLGEGSTVEANDFAGTGLGRDACTWPHMRSGGAQDIGVCDAWRVLVEQGLEQSRVDVAVIDQGFTATPDTPQGSVFHVPGMSYEGGAFWEGPPSATRCSRGADCGYHGTWTSSALGAVPDNAWGAAGPGGLNARIQHLDPAALLSTSVRSRLGSGAPTPLTLDQLQAGLTVATAERLPERSVGYVGVASPIPWPLSVLVARALDPVFARARDAGILVFAPAGAAHDVDQVHAIGTARTSGWETALTFPCELSGVVCVGALARDSDLRDAQSAFGSQRPAGLAVSNDHGTVDIYGPGTVAVGPEPGDALSTGGSQLRERSGTSLAAAFTAGVAVQVWAAHPSLSPADVEQILIDTMHEGSGSPEVVGWVDAAAAVARSACATPTTTFYADADGDGYGDPASAQESCLPPAGYVQDAGDCDDTDDAVFPGAEERCDGVDQNCDPDDEQGLSCDDGLFCTDDDACQDGACVGSGSPCNREQRCVESDDECVTEGCDEDADCEDDRYCNGDETCDTGSGECRDASRRLSDGVSCTDDTCNEGDDQVEHRAEDANCDDGRFCNGEETCDASEGCRPGAAACPDQVCNEATDECQACAHSADCNDGLFCNGIETCNIDAGLCVPGTPPATSDGIPCTVDLCNEFTNSIDHAPSNVVCDDGLYCNGAETCHVTLGCQDGTAPALSDSVSCTVDTCDEATDSVEHTPSNAACSDGLFCNGAETCHATLGCRAGTAPTLSDGVSCTTDSCSESTDTIVHAPNHGACDDDLFCNGEETCHATLGCQDGNAPCAASICVEEDSLCDVCTGDDDCDDGLFCNGEESCDTDTGLCEGGDAPSDPDGVDCTVDTCDEDGDDFVHTPDDGACDDDLYCNGAERCDELLDCQPRTPPSPSDGIGCTTDTCDEDTDSFVHAPVNGVCSDSLYCTGSETCHLTLGCQASGDPCSSGHCSEDLDVCVACLDDDHCDDELYCNGDETCDVGAGTCAAGSQVDVDDGIDCTDDSCDEDEDAIVHDPDDAACDDDLFCTGDETCDPSQGCEASGDPCADGHCNDTLDACVACLSDDDCDDGLFCNGDETCDVAAGTCDPGSPIDVDDGVDCTDDSCDEDEDEVVHTPDDAACDDDLFCNGAETCDAIDGCQDGTAPTIDDDVDCTDDACDEDADEVVHAPDHAACEDELFCNGDETCDPTAGCQVGIEPCNLQVCDEDNDDCPGG
jgi:hypothetical protein